MDKRIISIATVFFHKIIIYAIFYSEIAGYTLFFHLI